MGSQALGVLLLYPGLPSSIATNAHIGLPYCRIISDGLSFHIFKVLFACLLWIWIGEEPIIHCGSPSPPLRHGILEHLVDHRLYGRYAGLAAGLRAHLESLHLYTHVLHTNVSYSSQH
jgi:hypothetical protein